MSPERRAELSEQELCGINNILAQREKAETVLLRQAKDCRNRARDLLNKAESLESMSRVASVMSPDHEACLFEMAIRSNPAYQ